MLNFCDGSTGHQQAWEKAGILHRDVSVANILIDVESPPGNLRGFLTDWDLCKSEEQLESQTAPSQPGVSVSAELDCIMRND